MKSCQDCIHYEVCHKRMFPSIYGIFDDGCDLFASENPYKRALRFIYADLNGKAAKYRSDAENNSNHGRAGYAMSQRESASLIERIAGRVRLYCLKIGYDPAKDKLETKTEDQK